MSSDRKSESGFAFLGRDFKERFVAPIGHTNFWGYLIISILGLGGLSIYIEAGKYWVGTWVSSLIWFKAKVRQLRVNGMNAVKRTRCSTLSGEQSV
jgi:hypothetical protein